MLNLIDEQEVIRFVGGAYELIPDRNHFCTGILHQQYG